MGLVTEQLSHRILCVTECANTDSVNQDQTAQNVRSDLGSTLSDFFLIDEEEILTYKKYLGLQYDFAILSY